jgi:hypothetical protein
VSYKSMVERRASKGLAAPDADTAGGGGGLRPTTGGKVNDGGAAVLPPLLPLLLLPAVHNPSRTVDDPTSMTTAGACSTGAAPLAVAAAVLPAIGSPQGVLREVTVTDVALCGRHGTVRVRVNECTAGAVCSQCRGRQLLQ